MYMITEVLHIQGEKSEIIVEGKEAFLVKPNGKRRLLGLYAGMDHNTEQESVTLSIKAWVDPRYGFLRRALSTICSNSPHYSFEHTQELPTHKLIITGPVKTRMIPANAA